MLANDDHLERLREVIDRARNTALQELPSQPVPAAPSRPDPAPIPPRHWSERDDDAPLDEAPPNRLAQGPSLRGGKRG